MTETKGKKVVTYVFVYGTLKRGHGNHYLLSDAVYVGEATTLNSFYMSDVGFPYLSKTPQDDTHTRHQIKGEVYLCDDETLGDLDALEGVAYGHYYRAQIEVTVNFGVVRCLTYMSERASGRYDHLFVDQGERFYQWSGRHG